MLGRITLAAAVVAAAALAAGCGSDGMHSDGNPTATDVPFSASLAAREEAHHAAAQDASDVESLREETRGYAAAMDSIMGRMMDGCSAMMDSTMGGMMGGMMGGNGGMMGDMGGMRNMMDAIGGAVHEHHSRMDSLATLDEMIAECEEHHAAMVDMMDDLDETMDEMGGRMGGMMGDMMGGTDVPGPRDDSEGGDTGGTGDDHADHHR